jgi:hypothetical protein
MAILKLEVTEDSGAIDDVAEVAETTVFINTDFIVKIDEVTDESQIRRSRVFLADGSVLVTTRQAALIADDHNKSH